MNDSPEMNLERMNKRRELMEDKRRYIIYYTFGLADSNHRDTETQSEKDDKENKQ